MDDTATEQQILPTQLEQDVFYNLIHLANDGIILIDEDEKIFVYNDGAEKVFGHTANEILGKSIETLIPYENRKHHHQHIKTFKTANTSSRNMHSRNQISGLRKNGEAFPAEAAISKIKHNNRWVYMVILRDISENHHLMQELEHYKRHLEELVEKRTHELQNMNKELESFSYSVSHDLRAPLRSIDGFSQALLEDYQDQLDELGRHYLTRLRTASQNMGELIDNMLILSRVTRHDIQQQTVDMSEIARTIAEGLKQQDEHRDVKIVIPDELKIQGDAHLIKIMLDNLIGNAWKYSSKTAHAVIEFGKSEKEGEDIYYIKDNGSGFDMKYASKLFVAFQRLHSAIDYAGSGVGLATVYRIINRHNGRIWAEATPDKGATFYFTLNPGR
ncbi:MAG: PAS domain S-box protein [Gammaproteobacteria bacterium]|nr:PAS domain S-box protein [Gammaproteobacteria bacterium]